jgi:hypothetical protein
LLAPRLSPSLSPQKSRAQSPSPTLKIADSECRLDRRLIACSICSFDERAAAASISSVGIGGEQEGEHRGGNTPFARGVPPLEHVDFPRIAADQNGPGRPTATDKFNQRCELLDACDGRRSVPPAKDDDAGQAIKRRSVA